MKNIDIQIGKHVRYIGNMKNIDIQIGKNVRYIGKTTIAIDHGAEGLIINIIPETLQFSVSMDTGEWFGWTSAEDWELI